MRKLNQLHWMFFALAFIALFSACTKEEVIIKPKVEIISPTPNTVFYYGEKVKMKLSFDDTDGIQAYSYGLIPQNLNGTNYDFEKKMSLGAFVTYFEIEHEIELPKKYSATQNYDDGEYVLRIMAEDYKANLTVKDVLIVIKNKEEE
ncbi:DUF4625 domain-containing protein [Capnocytophaga sp. ARDL2]|uniref:DUF4625 domain-containing protein n=1 Tax=Capnocytophaga sp. ARDL2 TaxID=3238809 RepID=UPI003557BD9A